MSLPDPPVTLVILEDKDEDGRTEAMAEAIRKSLPEIDIQIEGAEPSEPYALIAFTPGPSISAYPKAEWIHIAGAGANGVLDALETAGLSVPPLITRTVGRMGQQIGEYVLSYVLADHQKHTLRRRLQSKRTWDVAAAYPSLVAGQTALILGTGAIGSGVANALRAIGMIPIGASRSGRTSNTFERVDRLDRLGDLSGVDVCIGALPLTDETHNLISTPLLSKLDNALFINVGRGATADIMAVQAALKNGCLRHAVLDVVPEEPLPPDSPFWTVPNLTLTPHVSGITIPEDTSDAFVAAWRALERGITPDLIVNPHSGY